MHDASIQQLWRDIWFPRFLNTAPRLRFELGGEDFDNITQPVPRFLQAHRRACLVADQIFADGCVAVVAWHPDDQPESAEYTGLEALARTGFRSSPRANWEADLYSDPEAAPSGWQLHSYNLGSDKVERDTLLWHSVSLEMPIGPSVPVTIFLIEPSLKIMLHVYDDRGMDIMAASADVLRPYYRQFDDWLLDCDRERMADIFKP